MKNKVKISDDYKQLKSEILRSTVLMMIIAAVAVFLLYDVVLHERFSVFVISFLSRFFYDGDYDRAFDVYQRIFRNHMDLFILMAICGIFLIILRIYLNLFTRYFTEINRGIDELSQETPGDIVLSSGLSATEKKLNSIKYTLERRKNDALIAEQRKNDLIVYLAHDLKTPLTSVIGYLSLMRDEPQISPELRTKYTDIALDKAERLEYLINEFFDITRFNLTAMVLEPERTNLSRMLEQITNEFNPILAEKELSWETDIARDVEILCDRDKMGRVFDNLIRNAVNYSYPQTALTLSMKAEGQQVEIRMKNHGRGIPPEKLSHIFEQFYRADTARSSSDGGAGLGLAISREIVELHGGTIRAESAGESVTFIVNIPADCKKTV